MIELDMDKAPNKIDKENRMVLEMLSNYLMNAPDFIESKIIEDIVQDCKVPVEYAFAVLLVAACGMDIDDNKMDKELFQQYFISMIHCLKAEDYYSNLYYKEIHFPNINIGKCELKQESYKPYEAFVWNDLEKKLDGRIIPQIGFFEQEFVYPAILEDGRIWMTITPNEIETMRPAIEKAAGRVLTFGLGLGYYSFMVSEKEEVSSVTVVEEKEEVIQLFERYILPQFKHGSKIRIVREDAFTYARDQLAKECFDFVFTDLWHDVSDGIDMYLKMKEFETLSPNTTFMYWIEKSMRCYL